MARCHFDVLDIVRIFFSEFSKNIFFSREIADEDERLRVYQLDRLKYYYAVCETDSPETADEIYKEFDGQDYGDSGVNGKWPNSDARVVILTFSGSEVYSGRNRFRRRSDQGPADDGKERYL